MIIGKYSYPKLLIKIQHSGRIVECKEPEENCKTAFSNKAYSWQYFNS